jgi:hypothetical protein
MSSMGYAQLDVNYDMLHYMAAQRPQPREDDKDAIKKQFQSHFIKKVFLNNVFKSNHLFYGDDNSNDYGLVNELMMNQFSDYLADSDFLDLSQINIDE